MKCNIFFFYFSFVRETDQIVLLSVHSSGFGREMEEEWGGDLSTSPFRCKGIVNVKIL